MSNTRIIEINGVKMEVDLRTAKAVESYKVGDAIKVLIKSYGDTYTSYVGTIIGFDEFKATPTVVIAYLDIQYNKCEIKFVYFNKGTKDTEITRLNEFDMPLKKSEILTAFNTEIQTKKKEIKEIEQKKNVFQKLFGKYFEPLETEAQ